MKEARPRFTRDLLPRIGIALYEPDAAIRSVLRGILHASGAREIITIPTRDTVGEMPGIELADLILLRFMVGKDLARAIRQGKVNVRPDVGIIAFQNEPTGVDLYRAMALGVDEFLAVPFNSRAVMAKVNTVLQSPKDIVSNDRYFGPDNRPILRAVEQHVAKVSGDTMDLLREGGGLFR